jgi:hypothetical protein
VISEACIPASWYVVAFLFLTLYLTHTTLLDKSPATCYYPQTCRPLRDVVASSTSLRYKLALVEYGMCDGTQNSLSTAEKLRLLTAYAAAWRSLDSVQPEKASMLVGWGAPIAASGNVMVFSKHKSQAALAYEGEVRLEPRQDLLVLRVPSALRRVKAAHWVLDLPASASELCVDELQDLLIYVLYVICLSFSFWEGDALFHFGCLGVIRDCKFYVRALSTGAVHPLVEHAGVFTLWKNGSRRCDVSDLAVCGDYIAAGTRVYFISAWNWKTGELVSEQVSTLFIPYHVLQCNQLDLEIRGPLFFIQFSR